MQFALYCTRLERIEIGNNGVWKLLIEPDKVQISDHICRLTNSQHSKVKYEFSTIAVCGVANKNEISMKIQCNMIMERERDTLEINPIEKHLLFWSIHVFD